MILFLVLAVVLGFPIMGHAGVWISDAPQSGYNYRSSVFLQDDFVSGATAAGIIGTLGWYTSGGTTNLQNGEANHPGIVRRNTSTTISTLSILALQTGIVSPIVSSTYSVRWLIRLNTVDANTTVRIGSLSSYSTNPPSDGAYFEKLDADTNWFFVTRQASVQTRTDTGIPVSTSWIELTIHSYGASAWGVINNTTVATHTTNITTQVHPAIHLINSVAESKTMDVDYCDFQMNLQR